MKLEEVGFYTLSDERVKNTSISSPLYRCELILTDRCNFNCPYCRGLLPQLRGDINTNLALNIIDMWSEHGLKNIRFSGGEPTLHPDIERIVDFTYGKNLERIAISTNGYSDFNIYDRLVRLGVNDFSISLDACCSSTGDTMSGRKNTFSKVVENIGLLAEMTYVTVGVVLTDDNISEVEKTVELAQKLNVADVRIIPAAQHSKTLATNGKNINLNSPILKYRINNMLSGRNIRGIHESDNHFCPLVMDDMAVAQEFHYPCIIYMREQGKPVGSMKDGIQKVRLDRYKWSVRHNCFDDHICKNNCLDVCVDYNNRFRELRG